MASQQMKFTGKIKLDLSKIKKDTETRDILLKARYLARDKNTGEICETIDEMWHRIAATVSGLSKITKKNSKYNDKKEVYDNYLDMMVKGDFLPNSPTIMNAGLPLGQLSACFVLPIGDSMEEIFDSLRNAALIHKSGGGTGFDFSSLRAKNSIVSSTGGQSSGPISFMEVFNSATEVIKQGGKRRGASMGVLRVDHPDIREFIMCKDDLTKFNNFNISVAVTDEFMEAVMLEKEYNVYDHKGNVAFTYDAREIFDMIVHQAWKNGEPGLLFIDEINRKNLYGHINATNPCGEQTLLPNESCNLGSINLVNMLANKDKDTVIFDYNKFHNTIYKAVCFLDNVIDNNTFPLEIIKTETERTRKIGLGFMGLADTLSILGLRYGSDEALSFIDDITRFFLEKATKFSEDIAVYTKKPFPAYKEVVKDYPDMKPRRNLYTTTMAPTGTISMIAGVSSGIEPNFALSYYKQCMDDTKFFTSNIYLEEIIKQHGFYSEELMDHIATYGNIKDTNLPDWLKDAFVTSHDVTPEEHITTQATLQKYVESSISKTINFPNDATEDDVRMGYLLAHELGCKGITVYRDGSRQNQVLNMNDSKSNDTNEEPSITNDVLIDLLINQKIRSICSSLTTTRKYMDEKYKIKHLERMTELFKNYGYILSFNEFSQMYQVEEMENIDKNIVLEGIDNINIFNLVFLREMFLEDKVKNTVEEDSIGVLDDYVDLPLRPLSDLMIYTLENLIHSTKYKEMYVKEMRSNLKGLYVHAEMDKNKVNFTSTVAIKDLSDVLSKMIKLSTDFIYAMSNGEFEDKFDHIVYEEEQIEEAADLFLTKKEDFCDSIRQMITTTICTITSNMILKRYLDRMEELIKDQGLELQNFKDITIYDLSNLELEVTMGENSKFDPYFLSTVSSTSIYYIEEEYKIINPVVKKDGFVTKKEDFCEVICRMIDSTTRTIGEDNFDIAIKYLQDVSKILKNSAGMILYGPEEINFNEVIEFDIEVNDETSFSPYTLLSLSSAATYWINETKSKINIINRPEELTGTTKKVKIGCGSMYVTVNSDTDNNVMEVFTTLGKHGGCSSQSEATARLVSLALRAGISIEDITNQIKGIKCSSCIARKKDGVNVISCPDAIAKAIIEVNNSNIIKNIKNDIEENIMGAEYTFDTSTIDEDCMLSDGEIEVMEQWMDGTFGETTLDVGYQPCQDDIPEETIKVTEEVYEEMKKSYNPSYLGTISSMSISKGVDEISNINNTYEICPECGERGLAFESGCQSCRMCGYSKCK